jgi:hypothetical protein
MSQNAERVSSHRALINNYQQGVEVKNKECEAISHLVSGIARKIYINIDVYEFISQREGMLSPIQAIPSPVYFFRSKSTAPC